MGPATASACVLTLPGQGPTCFHLSAILLHIFLSGSFPPLSSFNLLLKIQLKGAGETESSVVPALAVPAEDLGSVSQHPRGS